MTFLLVSYKLEAIIVAAVSESLETAGITGFEPVSSLIDPASESSQRVPADQVLEGSSS